MKWSSIFICASPSAPVRHSYGISKKGAPCPSACTRAHVLIPPPRHTLFCSSRSCTDAAPQVDRRRGHLEGLREQLPSSQHTQVAGAEPGLHKNRDESEKAAGTQHKVSLPSQLAIKNTERNENRWTGEKRQCMSTNLTHNAQKKGANGNKRVKRKTSTFLPPLRSPSTSLVY